MSGGSVVGDFGGRVALVTGASSGIGRACAQLLASQGASVMVTGRNQAASQETLALVAMAEAEGHLMLGDVSDSSFANALVAGVIDRFGRLDVVVNAAGVIVRADAEATTDEQWRWQIGANLDAPFFVSRAALPHLRAAGGGAIVNIASNVGMVGSPGLAGYCATKGAVISLTQAMALDHAAENIRINAVCPGAVDTPMLGSGREAAPMTQGQAVEMNLASIPQGRVPGPDEVAELVLFLASDKSRHITGTAVPIDGGYTAQ